MSIIGNGNTIYKVKEWLLSHKHQFIRYNSLGFVERINDGMLFKVGDDIIAKHISNGRIVGFEEDMIHVCVLIDGIGFIKIQINDIELEEIKEYNPDDEYEW